MARKITATQQATIDHNRAHIAALKARMTAVNTAPPAGYEATCPVCGQTAHATIVANFGRCLACQRAAQNV